ncbi:hypothetical protein [Aeromonas veronii]|nr:hypothetical protein [Aeromonas veronii]
MSAVATADAAQLITQGSLINIMESLQRRSAGNKKGCRSILFY